jgi:hypothetical protein
MYLNFSEAIVPLEHAQHARIVRLKAQKNPRLYYSAEYISQLCVDAAKVPTSTHTLPGLPKKTVSSNLMHRSPPQLERPRHKDGQLLQGRAPRVWAPSCAFVYILW